MGILLLGAPPQAVGKAQINLGPSDLTAQTFVNLFNGASFPFFLGGATPAATDDSGYPVQNFTGTIAGAFGYSDQTLSSTGPWTFSWPAGRSAFQLVFQSPATVTGAVNATVTNGAGVGNPTIVGDAVHAGSVTINWNSTTPVNFFFDGSYAGNYANNTSGVMSMVRVSDATAFAAGIYWTPEFVSVIKNLHPRSIRPMGWNLPRNSAADSNVAIWAVRKNTSNISFVSSIFPASTKSGGVSSFGSASYNSATGVYTAAAASGTSLAGWVNGETLTTSNSAASPAMTVSGAVSNAGKVQLTVNSTTGLSAGNKVYIINVSGTTEANGFQTIQSVDGGTTFTIGASFVHAYSGSGGFVGYQSLAITGKSGGSKIIFDQDGVPVGFGAISQVSSGAATYVYDSVLDVVIYTSDGVASSVPIEAQAQLANLVNANLWYNIPPWAVDDFITNTANAAFPILNSNLKFQVEYANEMWNFGFFSAHWAGQRAAVLGLAGGNLDYQALRLRQIHGNLLPASSWGGAMSRLERLYCIQGGTQGAPTQGFYFDGTDLVAGNAAYNLFTGGGSGQSYNVAPNRPIDFTDAIGYAPYVTGTALCGQSVDAGSLAPVQAQAAVLQSIVDNYTAGGAGITTAIALVDNEVRIGRYGVQTFTASGTTFTTPADHGFTAGVAYLGNSLQFSVTGGTLYSGLDSKKQYRVTTTPTTKTFTCAEVLASGSQSGSDVNVGSVGTGTASVGTIGFGQSQNFFFLQSEWYRKWETVAASYDASRPAAGLPNLKTVWYEGAIEVSEPTAAQCTAIGVNLAGSAANASAAIAGAILAWKNDAMSSLTIQEYYNSYMGRSSSQITFNAMPHSLSTSNLVLVGGGLYGLISNQSFVSPAAYQTYAGFAAFSAP
jgi:hypothetical protein